MSRILPCLIVLLLGAAGAPPARAADPPKAPDESTLHGQVARLNLTLAEVAALLDELVQRQQADLLMKRIQLATRGLADLERQVRSTRQEIESQEQGLLRLSEEIDRVESAEDGDGQPGMPQTAEARRQLKASMEIEFRFVTDRLSLSRNRIIELENDLLGRLESLEAWEELVDKALGLK